MYLNYTMEFGEEEYWVVKCYLEYEKIQSNA